MANPWSFTARWVFPVGSPPQSWAIVVVDDDRIIAIEPAGTRPVDLDLGNVAILPGLVNAHTHLDLTGMRGLARPVQPITDWLRVVIGHRRQRSAEQIAADLRAGVAECLRFGTTLVGDISGDGGSWDFLAAAPIRAVVFRELLGLTEDRAQASWDAFTAWREALPTSPTCRPGVSPHAPYSVRTSLYARAATAGLPLMTHLAETRDELSLLTDQSGPFVGFLQQLGVWDSAGLARGPEEVIEICTSAPRVLLAHGHYLQAQGLQPLGLNPHTTLVYCPRTHQAFGHEPYPLAQFLERGLRIALGTDSLASSPDLDILAEMRLVRKRYPDLDGATILRLGTLAGAEALGWVSETGSLEPGKSADCIVVEIPATESHDPHELILSGNGRVRQVLFRGLWIGG